MICSGFRWCKIKRSIGWISDRVLSVTEGKTADVVVGLFYSEPAVPWHAGLHAGLPDYDRRRCLGQYETGHVGLGHYQLRLVDRHRPRGNIDFGDSIFAAPNAGRTAVNRASEAMTIFAVMCARHLPGIARRSCVV